MMQAYVHQKPALPTEGGVTFEPNYPIPVPQGKQILIKVHASSLNPVGWKSISKPPFSYVHKRNVVMESDFSGVIAGGDLTGSGFALGQEVFGIIPAESIILGGNGTLAQYTIVDPVVSIMVPKPREISHEEAAAFPLAGLTAWYALVNKGGLSKGDGKRVFINGGSGGVGTWAIQIAKAFGAYVVSTASPSSESMIKSLGVDETIDYRTCTPSLAHHLSDKYATYNTQFDLFFDANGLEASSLFAASASFIKPEGVYLDIAGFGHIQDVKSALTGAHNFFEKMFRPTWLGGTPRKAVIILLPAGKMQVELTEAANLLATGAIKAVIDQIYPFPDAMKAYDRMMSGRTKGKVVVTVN